MSPPRVKIVCSCQQHLDVTGLDPFTIVRCPSCGVKLYVPPPDPPPRPGPARAPLKIVCSNCQQRLDVTDLDPLTSIRCPSCAMKLVVPDQRRDRMMVVQAQPLVAKVRPPAAVTRQRQSRVGQVVAVAACVSALMFLWTVWHYRVLIFGAAEPIARPVITQSSAAVDPTGQELRAKADRLLASGQYAEALAGYRRAESLLEMESERAALRCQIGAALYLLGKPREARAAFEQAVPPNKRQGLPSAVDHDNFVTAAAQVVLGVVKPEGAQHRFSAEFPAGWALTQFYLGAQALGEGRLAEATQWLESYAKPQPLDAEQWVLLFQENARPLAQELASLNIEIKQIAAARAEEKTNAAEELLDTLRKNHAQFVALRNQAVEDEITRLTAVLNQDPALQQRKLRAKEQQEIARITKLREQYAAESAFFPPAEQVAATAASSYDFAGAAAAYTSAASRMNVPELRKFAEDLAGLYARLVGLKQQAIEAMPRLPYAKQPLANRRGGAIAGTAVRADAQNIVFALERGETQLAWNDLDPASLLTLLGHYADMIASSPTDRASGFIALAWLARDLKRDRDSSAYAAYSERISADSRSTWARLTGPLPEPPALPGQPAITEDPVLATPRIPVFMKAGGVAQALQNPDLPSLLDIVPKK